MHDQIHATAAQARLGEYQGTHRPREHSSGVVILSVVTVLFGLFGFGALFGGGAVYLVVLFVPLSLGSAAWAVHAGYRAANKKRVRVDLFDHGLTYVDHGGRLSVFRWESVQVWQNFFKMTGAVLTHRTVLRYKLREADGSTVTIDSSHDGDAGLDEWGTLIQQGVTTAQLPGAFARFKNGEPVRFGDVVISRDRLGVKDRSWAWDEIGYTYLANGQVFVKERGAKRGKPFAFVSQIPNYYVFDALVRAKLAVR